MIRVRYRPVHYKNAAPKVAQNRVSTLKPLPVSFLRDAVPRRVRFCSVFERSSNAFQPKESQQCRCERGADWTLPRLRDGDVCRKRKKNEAERVSVQK